MFKKTLYKGCGYDANETREAYFFRAHDPNAILIEYVDEAFIAPFLETVTNQIIHHVSMAKCSYEAILASLYVTEKMLRASPAFIRFKNWADAANISFEITDVSETQFLRINTSWVFAEEATNS